MTSQRSKQNLNHHDLIFIVKTLIPGQSDRVETVERLGRDSALLETMLDDDRLFQRFMQDDNVLLQVSPWLFFTVFLRRARRDLAKEAFTVEQRGRQKVALFDTDQVIELLEQEPVRDYLASLLASFTRVENVLVLVEKKPGAWRGYSTNELNVEGMVRYSQTLDEPFRFGPYRRIGDVCLFLTGMFPEFINRQHRYPASGQIRPRMRAKVCQTLADHEDHGRSFYRLAAAHDRARWEGLDEVLVTLSENFILATKPLAFLANRYLQFTRHRLFNS